MDTDLSPSNIITVDLAVLNNEITISNINTVSSSTFGTAFLAGPAGPANTLAIGTVTTGAPGSLASASVTGDVPNQFLNLSIPTATIPVKDEGTLLTSALNSINFTGAGITATQSSGDVTVNVSAAAVPDGTTQVKGKVYDRYIDIRDYGAVGDNATDNTTFISNAIIAANTAGVPTYIPIGIFLTGRISVPSSSVIFGADKFKSIIKRKNATNNYVFQNADTTGGNTNITLKNFTVDGNWTNQASAPYHWLNWQNVSYYVVQDMHVTNSGNTRLRNASHGLIEGNYMESAITTIDTVAFSLEEGASHNRIIGNETYHYCNSVNINGPTVETINNTVTGNNFHDDGYYDGYIPVTRYGDAVLIGGAMCHGNTVSANTISNVGEDGIRQTDGTYDNTITGNSITKTGRHGISLNETTINSVVSGNTIRLSGTTMVGDSRTVANGIFLDITTTDNTIIGNNVKQPTQDGIQITSGSLRNNIVNNQVYSATRYGIYVLAHNTSVSGNKVFGNGVTQNGIYVLNCRNTVISGGAVASCTTNGIRIQNNTTSNQTNGTVVTGVRTYDDQGTRTQGVGINIIGTTFFPQYTTVVGCDVRSNLNNGIVDQGEFSDIHHNQGHNPENPFDLGSVTGTFVINRQNGNFQTMLLTGNVTPTFTSGKETGDTITLKFTQDATGGRTFTAPSNFKLAQGGTLPLSATGSAVDFITATWDGSNWYEISRALASASSSSGNDSTKVFNITTVNTFTSNQSLTANTKNVADTTSGDIAFALPATSIVGQIIMAQKANVAANILNVTGKINGAAGATLPLRTALQGKLFQATDTAGNWEIIAGDLNLAALDTRFTRQRVVLSLATTTTLGTQVNTDYVYFLNSGAIPTLPTAVNNLNRYSITNSDTTNKTLTAAVGETILGSSSITLIPNQSVDLLSNQTSNWSIF